MSTNHTENYSLSQWEADDKVLREDFNRDNQIIDEVLARTDRRGLQLIRDYKTTADSTKRLYVDMSGVDWSEWKIIIIDIYPAAGTSSKLHFSHYNYEEGEKPISPWHNTMVLFPLGSADNPIFCFTGTTGQAFYYAHNYRISDVMPRLEAANYPSSETVKAGTRVVVRGERM